MQMCRSPIDSDDSKTNADTSDKELNNHSSRGLSGNIFGLSIWKQFGRRERLKSKEKTIMLSNQTATETGSETADLMERGDRKTSVHATAPISSEVRVIDCLSTLMTNFPTPAVRKFVFGTCGICLSYLVYGHFQEDLFSYVSPIDGMSKFHQAWLLQFLESFANLLVGLVIRIFYGGENNLPLLPFFAAGATQLFAKTFTSLALAAGLSFPICILAKSAKMVPVMLGQLASGGVSYTKTDYCIALAIVSGTALLTLGSSKVEEAPATSSATGVVFIFVSLFMDGVTACFQKRLKNNLHKMGKSLRTNDLLLWINMAMAMTALGLSGISGDWTTGWTFLRQNPPVVRMIVATCFCSVMGQTFIFFMIANFDPLACSTVTTSRKILSVLWSLASKGHTLSNQGMVGVTLALTGLAVETRNKIIVLKNPKQ